MGLGPKVWMRDSRKSPESLKRERKGLGLEADSPTRQGTIEDAGHLKKKKLPEITF
jgi:hypothetical protein